MASDALLLAPEPDGHSVTEHVGMSPHGMLGCAVKAPGARSSAPGWRGRGSRCRRASSRPAAPTGYGGGSGSSRLNGPMDGRRGGRNGANNGARAADVDSHQTAPRHSQIMLIPTRTRARAREPRSLASPRVHTGTKHAAIIYYSGSGASLSGWSFMCLEKGSVFIYKYI